MSQTFSQIAKPTVRNALTTYTKGCSARLRKPVASVDTLPSRRRSEISYRLARRLGAESSGAEPNQFSRLHPPPRICDLRLQIGTRRLPAKQRASAAGISDQDRWIARAARGDFGLDAALADDFGRRNHFLN